MARLRKDHKGAIKPTVTIVRRKKRAKLADIKAAQERAGYEFSTFAVWNARNKGLIRRIRGATYVPA